MSGWPEEVTDGCLPNLCSLECECERLLHPNWHQITYSNCLFDSKKSNFVEILRLWEAFGGRATTQNIHVGFDCSELAEDTLRCWKFTNFDWNQQFLMSRRFQEARMAVRAVNAYLIACLSEQVTSHCWEHLECFLHFLFGLARSLNFLKMQSFGNFAGHFEIGLEFDLLLLQYWCSYSNFGFVTYWSCY